MIILGVISGKGGRHVWFAGVLIGGFPLYKS
jgi:hypothetical protein